MKNKNTIVMIGLLLIMCISIFILIFQLSGIRSRNGGDLIFSSTVFYVINNANFQGLNGNTLFYSQSGKVYEQPIQNMENSERIIKFQPFDEKSMKFCTNPNGYAILSGLDTNPADVYSYYHQFVIYNEADNQTISLEGQFSNLACDENKIFLIKYNIISNFDEEISTVWEYAFDEDDVVQSNVYSFPLEVEYFKDGFFKSISNRECYIYKLTSNDQFISKECSDYVEIYQNMVCEYKLGGQNWLLCENGEFALPQDITDLYINNNLYMVNSGVGEDIAFAERNIDWYDGNTYVLEGDLPLAEYNMICENMTCIFYNTNDIFIVRQT